MVIVDFRGLGKWPFLHNIEYVIANVLGPVDFADARLEEIGIAKKSTSHQQTHA